MLHHHRPPEDEDRDQLLHPEPRCGRYPDGVPLHTFWIRLQLAAPALALRCGHVRDSFLRTGGVRIRQRLHADFVKHRQVKSKF